MGIRQFQTVMAVWNILCIAIVIFCIILAISSLKRNNKMFLLSYVLEAVTVLVNLFFMYIIDRDYVDYGNDKFSGLSALGDWVGFGILILITIIPLIFSVACNVRYVIKKRRQESI